jgi:diadenosine tetraphosphatase ApaH/serine/threonine PP2A family protein phosphatase
MWSRAQVTPQAYNAGQCRTSTCLDHLNKHESVGTNPFSLHSLEKLHHLLRLPILHIFCELLIPCKNVQLHCAWCHCSHLCCHLWQGLTGPQARALPVSSYIWNPGTFPLSTTRNPDQADQPCILHIPGIKWYHKNRETDTDLFH